MAVTEIPVTPAEVTPTLRELIDELVPGGEPVYIDVVPVEDASVNDCFLHVQDRVRAEGGSSILGWSLWELPGVFVEAEAHSVWLNQEGKYLDISPKLSPSARVFFLVDPNLRYEARQINNVRRPVTREPMVRAFLDTFDDEFRLMNRGDRAGQFGQIALSGTDLMEYEEIQLRRAQARAAIEHLFPTIGPYSPCPCGSGRKLKWCHKGVYEG